MKISIPATNICLENSIHTYVNGPGHAHNWRNLITFGGIRLCCLSLFVPIDGTNSNSPRHPKIGDNNDNLVGAEKTISLFQLPLKVRRKKKTSGEHEIKRDLWKCSVRSEKHFVPTWNQLNPVLIHLFAHWATQLVEETNKDRPSELKEDDTGLFRNRYLYQALYTWKCECIIDGNSSWLYYTVGRCFGSANTVSQLLLLLHHHVAVGQDKQKELYALPKAAESERGGKSLRPLNRWCMHTHSCTVPRYTTRTFSLLIRSYLGREDDSIRFLSQGDKCVSMLYSYA